METVGKKIPKASHILQLTTLEKKQFLESFDFVFCDCDGVVWSLIEPIPKTGESIVHLKNAGKQIKFISNNSMRTDEEYIAKFTKIGVQGVKSSDLVHPVKTITRYLKSMMPDQKFYSLCSTTMNKEFVRQGIDLVTMEPCATLEMEELSEAIKPKDEVSAVIIDINFNLSYVQLARAQQYLLNKNCSLIVGAGDRCGPITKDLDILAVEGFLNLLVDCSGKTAILLGKPGPNLGKDLIELIGVQNTGRVLFIGDSLTSDVQFGIQNGFQTLFVFSGSGTKKEMLMLPDELKPDYVADSLADFIKFFEALTAHC